MIVFTATEKSTGKVFTGSTRRLLDDHWAHLVSLLDQGGTGPFFELLQEKGAEAFDVSEWGASENPAELREMLNEATEALGASVIKGIPTGVKARTDAFDSVRKELESITAAQAKPLRHSSAKQQADEMKALIAGIELRRRGGLKSARKTSSRAAKAKAAVVEAASSPVKAPSLPTGRVSSAAKERRIREALAEQKAEMESQQRQKRDEEAAEMRALLSRLDERSKGMGKPARRR